MKNKRTPDIRFAGFIEDWEQRKLGELIEISSAARVHKNEWTTSGVRFFRSSDVVSNFNGKKNTPAFISYNLYDELSKKSGIVQPGDILVTGGGSIGIPYLIADQEPLYFKDADLIWLQSANKIDGYFLYSYFVTPKQRKYVSSITHIGTISHYTIEQAKDTPIILPERAEQTLIGDFFKQLDDTISLHQQELTTLKQTKQGFLQKMHPKEGETVPEVRFPGFTGDWKQHKLGDLADFSKGSGYSKSDLTDEGKPIILYGRLYTKYETVIESIDTFTVEKENSVISQGNEVIVPASGETSEDISRASAVSKPGIILGGDLNIVRPNNEIDPIFLALTISNGKQQKELSKRAQGKSVVHLHNSDLKEVNLLFPKKEEQTLIGNFFRHLDDIIALHQHELDALIETKKAFLQKMFV